jgi:hypothetical protein
MSRDKPGIVRKIQNLGRPGRMKTPDAQQNLEKFDGHVAMSSILEFIKGYLNTSIKTLRSADETRWNHDLNAQLKFFEEKRVTKSKIYVAQQNRESAVECCRSI